MAIMYEVALLQSQIAELEEVNERLSKYCKAKKKLGYKKEDHFLYKRQRI